MLDSRTLRTQFGVIRLNWQDSSGHAKEKPFRDHDRAVAAYHKAIEGKLSEGYQEKYERKVSLPAASPDLKKFGKQGSR
jgi:predicted DNA-binding WGR domain protein